MSGALRSNGLLTGAERRAAMITALAWLQRSSARSSISASDAGWRVVTGMGNGPVTVARFSRPA